MEARSDVGGYGLFGAGIEEAELGAAESGLGVHEEPPWW